MAIRKFHGQHEWLSNFFPAPVALDGVTYPTVEHAFQAAKTLDPAQRAAVLRQETPGRAKYEGRRVTLRQDWERVKDRVMYGLLKQKFAPGTQLAHKLDATGSEELIEGTMWHDRYWGVCNCPKCKGAGENHLGKLLMTVREVNRGGVEPDWAVNA